MNAVQCKMARAALGLGVREVAELAKVSPDTVARLERGEVLRERTIDAIQAALEVAGVEFIPENGGGPGVRMGKMQPKRLDERQRAEIAKSYVEEWNKYCKEHDSMAFASFREDRILIQYRLVNSLETFNLLNLRVLETGFEVEGRNLGEIDMQRVVIEALDSRPRFP